MLIKQDTVSRVTLTLLEEIFLRNNQMRRVFRLIRTKRVSNKDEVKLIEEQFDLLWSMLS